jgi:hypothetical protein
MTSEIEVDQSNKVERTERDTVLAFSNCYQRTILIPARVKREAIAHLKAKKPRMRYAYLQIFAAGVFILLYPYLASIIKNRQRIIIDTEYPGHDDKIKSTLFRCINRSGFNLPKERISFMQVGKRSPAHYAALRVSRRQVMPDYCVNLEELLELL